MTKTADVSTATNNPNNNAEAATSAGTADTVAVGTHSGKTEQPHVAEVADPEVKQALEAVQKVATRREQLLARIPRVEEAVALALGRVAVVKWKHRVAAARGGEVSSTDIKNARTAASSARFSALEVSEGLMNLVIELDAVETHGNQQVRATRKAQVVAAQEAMPQADKLKDKALRMEAFVGRVLDLLPVQPDSPVSDLEDADMGGMQTPNVAVTSDTPVARVDDEGDVDMVGGKKLNSRVTVSVPPSFHDSGDVRACERAHGVPMNAGEDSPVVPCNRHAVRPPSIPLRPRVAPTSRSPRTIPITQGPSPQRSASVCRPARPAPTASSLHRRASAPRASVHPSSQYSGHPATAHQPHAATPHSTRAWPRHAHQPHSRLYDDGHDLYSDVFGTPWHRGRAPDSAPRQQRRMASPTRSRTRYGYPTTHDSMFGGLGGFGRDLFNTGFW